MKTEKVYTQNNENKEWMNSISFYNDEIRIMEHRLSEIASKYTSKEVLARVEHFQNQFILKRDNIDNLKHQINLSNDSLIKEVNSNITAIDRRKVTDHSELRKNTIAFVKNFQALRSEFNLFLSKYM